MKSMCVTLQARAVAVVVNVNWLLGMALGIVFMDDEDKKNFECSFGMTLFLGPVALTCFTPA